jgi:UDP-N-acetylmuramoyl-tripeptide--D-alanyl-D-alanine ligase
MKWLKEELESKGILTVRHFGSHSDLIEGLKHSIRPGDRILIKGSRGMKMETVLKALLEPRNPQ